MAKRTTPFLVQAARAWYADNVFKHSAAVSFYTLFSLAPVSIIAVTLAGIVLGRDEAMRQFGLQVAALVGPASAELIAQAAAAGRIHGGGGIATGIGIVLLLVGATSVFSQLQASLNDIWGVRSKPGKSGWLALILHRLLSFAMVLTMGFLLLVSLVLSTYLSSAVTYFSGIFGEMKHALQTADLFVSLLVITTLFALIFKVLPDVRIGWRDVWPGAVLTATLFLVGRSLIAFYLGHSTVASIYGAAGSLVALLIWIYYSSAILFFGAEFVRIFHQRRHRALEPKSTAALIGRENSTVR